MEHQIIVFEEESLIWVQVIGKAHLSGMVAFIEELMRPPYQEMPYPVIIDLRACRFGGLSVDDIRGILRFTADHDELIMNVKHAALVSEMLQYGLVRMFQLLAGSESRLHLNVFYSEEEARQWLAAKDETGDP